MEETKIDKYGDKTRIFRVMREAVPYLIIILVVILIRTFIMTPVKVNGTSMSPTLKEGEILILNKYKNKYKRFDIVVINHDGTKIIKRIIGMPGESVEYKDCKIYINGEIIEDVIEIKECRERDFILETQYNYIIIPEGYYFVMGDNRENSSDSRDERIGLIKKSQIEGTATIRIFPFNRMGQVK